MAEVFAIVVTWNGEKYLRQCLQSLEHSTLPPRVVVIDNASTDGTLKLLKSVTPGAKVFPLNRNLGFGRANNIGIKYAYENGAQHVLLINQDAYVALDVISGLVDLQMSNPDFGILSPLHLSGSGDRLDSQFCRHLAKSRHFDRLLSDSLLSGHLRQTYPVEFLNAAIWLLSRRCVERVGLFNPVFQHYGEDLEYTDRVAFHGLRVGIAPNLHGFHDRIQTPPDGVPSQTLDRYLMLEKATVRYRLSRNIPGLLFNFISAVSIPALASLPGRSSFLEKIRVRLILLFHVFSSLPGVIRTKRVARAGGKCFFRETDRDSAYYLRHCESQFR